MPKTKLTNQGQVGQHIEKLDATIQDAVQLLRQIILNSDDKIGEHIKWNNPAFYYTGEMEEFDAKQYKRDIVVMNLHKNRLMLVFPTGVKVNDTTGFLEGNYPDGRRVVSFKDINHIKANAHHLSNVIKQWILLVK
ncbi:DUF1801 domain-containing protein [Mucilaginibacter segetis]|uniref:DUF1801 domain-containing protein n=1 Tax=Mucilaginibacter segetis TaxID=2793071 RepID=A0A934PTM3_9SPHI|nr:DUF1801 domain-containing protein [Mucilaginibacter segetis]MBK0380614.1 DUF1801 domain-containing protein [Mucilaginibacter segetis]